ncbi:MAG: hypothetical protein M0T78_12195 [Actinomycetota bacterium]|nr:hypothetical protein [Actinomycetota bacterium]
MAARLLRWCEIRSSVTVLPFGSRGAGGPKNAARLSSIGTDRSTIIFPAEAFHGVRGASTTASSATGSI